MSNPNITNTGETCETPEELLNSEAFFDFLNNYNNAMEAKYPGCWDRITLSRLPFRMDVIDDLMARWKEYVQIIDRNSDDPKIEKLNKLAFETQSLLVNAILLRNRRDITEDIDAKRELTDALRGEEDRLGICT